MISLVSGPEELPEQLREAWNRVTTGYELYQWPLDVMRGEWRFYYEIEVDGKWEGRLYRVSETEAEAIKKVLGRTVFGAA